MSKVRILFLGTPEFAAESLKLLVRDDHYDIAAVVTQPDRPAGRKMQPRPSPVKEVALAAGLRVHSPETVNTAEFRAETADLKCEAAAVVAFGQILGQKFLDLFPRGCVNVHGSLLPRWRGAAPIQRAIMAGDRETGVALQLVVKKLDAGDVLGARRIELRDEDDAVAVYDRLKVLGADLLHIEFMDYLRGNLVAHPQDESQVTHAAKIEKAEARIDWTRSARDVANQIRGLALGPYAFCLRGGKPLKLRRARARDGAAGAPGEVVQVAEDRFAVACGEGALEVLEAQPESRANQSAESYLRGYPLKVGDRFE